MRAVHTLFVLAAILVFAAPVGAARAGSAQLPAHVAGAARVERAPAPGLQAEVPERAPAAPVVRAEQAPVLDRAPSDTARIPDHAARSKEAGQAARAAEAAREARMGLRQSGSARLGLPTPDLGSRVPGNRDRLGQPGIAAGHGGFLRHDRPGVGPQDFGGLANSHSRPAPGTGHIAVTPERIGAARDGVAGQRSGSARLPVYNPKDTRNDQVYTEHYTPGHGHTSEVVTTKNRPDGRSTVIRDQFVDSDGDSLADHQNRPVTEYDADGIQTEETAEPARPTEGVAELRDPDSAPGGGWVPHWMEREGETLRDRIETGSPNHELPAGPDEGATGTAQEGPPVVTQEDLTAKYDPDGAQRSLGEAKQLEDLCYHSEC